MIHDLKPYPRLTESGVAWMYRIPTHWKVLRGKFLFRCVDVRSKNGEEELLTVSSDQGVVRRSSVAVTMFKAESYVGHKLCWPGDLVINSLWAWAGGLGVTQYHGIISSVYGVYRLRDSFDAYSSYIDRLVRSKSFNLELRVRSKGIWISRLQLTDEAFLSARFPIPPEEERSAIIRFLDHADRRLQRYIRAKQKLIALLEEQKQAIIHQAVIGQIDVRSGKPYPAYRTSRTECLGSIPKHWKLARLKDVAQVQPGLTLGKDYSSTETISRPYLRVANVQDGRIDLSHVKSVEVPVHEARATTLLDGDVLMTEGGDIDKLGRGGIWRDEIRGCLHQNHIFAVRCCQESVRPEFLVGLMASSYGRSYFQITAKQTTNLASTNSSTLRAFPIPLPSADEQKVILRCLSRNTRLVDEAIGRTERLIYGVREYRARLINDVVTGRVDVRAALASRPDRMAVEEFRAEQDGVTV